MQVKIVGYTEHRCPVFMVQAERFSIHEFAKQSFSEAPVLILQYEVTYVYGFTHVRQSRDMHQEWNGGKMEPFACLSDADCKTLLDIADSTAEQSAKDQQVQEILERNTFMHFGSGS